MNYSAIAETLTRSLALHRPPIAITFADHVPAGVGTFDERVPAGCRFWQEAANRAFATSARDHELCAIGIYTHNLNPTPHQQQDLTDALAVFQDLGYVRPEDLPLIPVVEHRAQHVIYSPLSQAPLAPDLVLLFVDADQTLILSEATSQVENQNAPAMGRPACAVVPQVMNTGRAALSLGCCGARAYLDYLDSGTALFAIPAPKLESYTDRIESLSQANATLSKFHRLRRHEIANGQTPTIKQSLVSLQSRYDSVN